MEPIGNPSLELPLTPVSDDRKHARDDARFNTGTHDMAQSVSSLREIVV